MAAHDDQQQHWNAIHTEGRIKKYTSTPSEFAREAVRLFPPGAKIAELGCGFGTDAAFFAQQGHSVIATDFAEVAIAHNIERYRDTSGLEFKVADTSSKLPFQNSELDGVYARLSLHYFPDQTTQRIFQDIHRILKPGGILAFMCKSTDDPLYGKGTLLEPDMFDDNGHVRHFFSEAYVKTCLAHGYRIEKIESERGNLYGQPSAFIKVISQKT